MADPIVTIVGDDTEPTDAEIAALARLLLGEVAADAPPEQEREVA